MVVLWVDLDFRNYRRSRIANHGEKTAAPASVTGDAGLVDQHQDTIAVAVEAQFDEPLRLARGFALAPQCLA